MSKESGMKKENLSMAFSAFIISFTLTYFIKTVFVILLGDSD